MVVLDDVRRSSLDIRVGLAIDDRRLMVGVEERLHFEGDAFVLKRLDGLGVDDGSPVKSQLNGFGVGDVAQLNGFIEAFRVGIEQAVDVFPDGDFFGVEAIGEDGRSVVGTLTAQGDGVFAIHSCADETLGDANHSVDMLVVQFTDAKPGLVPVGGGGAEAVVGEHVFACVKPAAGYVTVVEVFLDDGGGDQFTITHRLVVLVVVRLVGALQLLPKL